MATAPPPTALAPALRVAYRSGLGEVDMNYPPERINHAIADEGATVWVDILGVDGPVEANAPVAELLREVFDFHPLAIDDALTETHVPKVDDWARYLYLVFHTIDFHPETDDLQLHELDIFLGRNYLVTYHVEPIAILENVRRNLMRDNGDRLRNGPDHLLYHILDLGVADYLAAIEHLDEAIDRAQDEVFRDPTNRTLRQIFRVKRSALRIHRLIAPQREVLNRLARDEYAQIDARDRVYFRDVYDHLVRLHDITETLRDLISGALDTYLSALSNRTNDIMKALTIVTVMFLPLNFVVGFFGMNFFGATLEFHTPQLPNTLIFLVSCLSMLACPFIIWFWSRRQGWWD